METTTTNEETFNLPLTDYEATDLYGFMSELSDHYYEAHHYTENVILAFNFLIEKFKGSPRLGQIKSDKDSLILLFSLLQRERKMISTITDKAKILNDSVYE